MVDFPDAWRKRDETPIDFIVVGAGAGGAPLAARLVERGYTVLVLEMGPKAPPPPAGVAVETTDVPLLHPATTEDPRHSLRFFVKHFEDPRSQALDWKLNPPDPRKRDEGGIFYPRSQGVGGCSIHNAMITICGPSEDWDEIAEATEDESWRGERMRRYFERVEACHYARPTPWARLVALFGLGDGWSDGRHGTRGWLDVTMADLRLLLSDPMFLRVALGGALATIRSGIERIGDLLKTTLAGRLLPGLDPNHWQTMRRNRPGLTRIPVAVTPDGRRSSPRDRLLKLLDGPSPHGKRLLLETGFCVTGLVIDDEEGGPPGGRARGVAGLAREHVYEADPAASESKGVADADLIRLYCRREVILCGGAFNSPQLLMLSGIGPAEHLEEIGVPVRLDLPEVGRNLQDRYEVPVVAHLTGRFRSLDDLTLDPTRPDRWLRRWKDDAKGTAFKRGLYASTGGLMGLFLRSEQEEVFPDLFTFAIVGSFEGYRVGYSAPDVQLPTLPGDPPGRRRTLTWLLLKARTRNRSGYVQLRSPDPLRRPEINFNFFPPGDADGGEQDLKALHEGVKFVEEMLLAGKASGAIEAIDFPGATAFANDLKEWIRHTAWGHHACGTCRMGTADDPCAVVDPRFRVRGVAGLRIVDASIFPRIPGFFVAASVYTIAEKAADVIAEDHPLPAAGIPPAALAALAESPIERSRPDFVARKPYPVELERAEAKLVAARRRAAGHDPGDSDSRPWLLGLRSPGGDAAPAGGRDEFLPPDAFGLAIAGEGVRAAAFGLGMLQAMSKAGWLRRVDYLSTVSGGGPIGAFLGRWFDSYRSMRGEPAPAPGAVHDRIARSLVDPRSAPIEWLRRHCSYVTPGGTGDAAQNLVVNFRGLLAFHLVLGALILAASGAIQAPGYLQAHAAVAGGPSWARGWVQPGWAVDLQPIVRALPAGSGGVLPALAEGSLWLAAVPLLLAYWLVSQDLPESFVAPILISAAVVAGASLLLTGSSLTLIVLAAAILWALASWAVARREEGPANPRNPYRRMLARELVGRRLTFWVMVTVALGSAGAINALGRWAALRLPYEGYSVGGTAGWFAAVTAVIALPAWLVQATARMFVALMAKPARALATPAAATIIGVLPLAVVGTFVADAMYGGGSELVRGLAVTATAAAVSLLLGTRECLPLINRSGTFSVRAGRLSRTFLGAVNPARRTHAEGSDVTRPVTGDDVSFDRYHPELAGGPLHLINCAVSQTIDPASFRATTDRGAAGVTVGPSGMSVGRAWHAAWKVKGEGTPPALEPLGAEAPDPFLAEGDGEARAEPLTLEDWVAISGTPSVEGGRLDQTPSRWQALGGMRPGYWWDSGRDARERAEAPIKAGLLRVFGASLARLFRAQTLLLSELTGKFGGPWTRHWYLSNGDVVDGTAAFELIRRRLPFVVVCDAGSGLGGRGSALAGLVRSVRNELGADVIDAAADRFALANLGLPPGLAAKLGSLDDLVATPASPPRGRAALLRVRYPAPPPDSGADRYLSAGESWLLYVRATCIGDEPVDVRAYAEAHPDFPDERAGVADFDERRWESHRLLGEHIGRGLFG